MVSDRGLMLRMEVSEATSILSASGSPVLTVHWTAENEVIKQGLKKNGSSSEYNHSINVFRSFGNPGLCSHIQKETRVRRSMTAQPSMKQQDALIHNQTSSMPAVSVTITSKAEA